ncbi:hypothetical protein FRB94_008457 [Tulasnella sp. JGI-2019a]|nr:hypothetical protein FRB94_008457 [Tulasnella sp. JGI-2019a]
MAPSNFAALVALSIAVSVSAQSAVWGQCGGIGWTGPTTCVAGSVCTYSNPYYSQCLPGTTTVAGTTTSKAGTTTTSTAGSTTITGLRGLNTLARAKGRYFGSAPDAIWSNTDTAYLQLTGNSAEFGMITPANAMKYDTIEPSRGTFAYTHADYVVSWAKTNGQAVRGHNFVWYNQVPSWVTSGGFNNATLISILQNHIANEAGHYDGKLYCWDVVNEPFNDDGTWRSDVWYNTIGPSFVPIAFKAARAADPTAKLYINDYNIETVGAKSNAHYTLAQQMIAQGVPYQGIGCQAHLIVGSTPSASSVLTNYNRFAALGMEWALTELDIRMTLPSTAALLAQQATDYATIVSACTQSTACVGITTWDTSDDYSWVPSTFSGQGAALLFDANNQPKPAYYSVANTLAAATTSSHYTV